jgi:hypothetical protein
MGQGFSYKAGRASAERFKVSGRPYLKRHMFSDATGSQEDITVFPSMTRSMTLVNEADNASTIVMRLHFDTMASNAAVVDSNGEGANIRLGYGESVSLDVKAAKVYVSRDTLASGSDSYYTLIAEVTDVPITDYVLSGSGINQA